jgi:hypothetical protein
MNLEARRAQCASLIAPYVLLLGRRCGLTTDQRRNEAQEFLLLRSVAHGDEKGADLDIDHLTAGRQVRLVPDKYPAAIAIMREQPAIPVGAKVNLSGPNGHASSLLGAARSTMPRGGGQHRGRTRSDSMLLARLQHLARDVYAIRALVSDEARFAKTGRDAHHLLHGGSTSRT